MMKKGNDSLVLLLSCLILTIVIFIVDLQIPLGVAGAVPYISVILIAGWLCSKKLVIGFAVLCSFLTLLGLFFSPEGGEYWKVLANRVLAFFAIWVTATLVIRWNSIQEKIFSCKYEAKKEKEKKEIYIATMESAHHITGNLLNQLQLIDMEIQKNNDIGKELSVKLHAMTDEASDLLLKLSSVKQIAPEIIKESVRPTE